MNKKDIVREYIRNHIYFSLQEVVEKSELTKQVAKNYLQQLIHEGQVFSAGYGFYSTLKKELILLKHNRVEKIRQKLKKKFPFAKFAVWNTLQLQSFYHHMQTHHITFVETISDAIFPFFEVISDDYKETMVEKKSKLYYEQFDIRKDPVIVRRLISRSPSKEYTPALEKILVDLFIDKDKYHLMSDSDYWEMLQSISSLYRIDLGIFVSYSRARNRLRSICAQLFENKRHIEVTFAENLKKVAKVTF